MVETGPTVIFVVDTSVTMTPVLLTLKNSIWNFVHKRASKLNDGTKFLLVTYGDPSTCVKVNFCTFFGKPTILKFKRNTWIRTYEKSNSVRLTQKRKIQKKIKRRARAVLFSFKNVDAKFCCKIRKLTQRSVLCELT